MKTRLRRSEDARSGESERRWPGYLFNGRIRTSTVVLIIAFVSVWWVYDTYRSEPAPPAAPQVVPPGFIPDPAYTWVPRTRVRQPPTTTTEAPAPTTTETSVPPTSETPTPVPGFPFCPPLCPPPTTEAPPGHAPPPSSSGQPPPPAVPGLPQPSAPAEPATSSPPAP